MNSERFYLKISTIGVATGIILGAFGAHSLKEIFSRLYNKNKLFLTKDILNLLDKETNLMQINKDITRNQGYLDSLKNERA